jgi:hypothetical protein
MLLALVFAAAAQTGGSNPPAPQAAQPTASAPAPASAQAVTSYPASFFAAAQPNTAADMIDRLPGFVFDDGDSSVRGFAGAAGNVLIDGQRPTTKSDDLNAILRRIPASQVERIDVIRGGAPGIDMQGKTVIANVIRKSAASTTGLFAVSNQYDPRDGRQAPAIRLEGTRRADGTSLEGSVVIGGFYDDGWGDGTRVRRDGQGALLLDGTDITEGGGYQGVATGAYERPLFGGKFRINLTDTYTSYTDHENVFDSTPSLVSAEADTQKKNQAEVDLHYNRDFGSRTVLETLFVQQLGNEIDTSYIAAPGEIDDFRENQPTGESILRSTLTYRYSPTLAFETGGEGAFNWLDARTTYTENGAPVVVPAANVHVEEKRGEAFAQATWKATPKLSVEAALRVEGSIISSSGDVNLSKTLFFPKPRLSVSWSPTADDQFRLRLEREVGQLDFSDFVAAASLSTGQVLAGNPNLVPQQAWVVEVAYERHFWKDGAAVLTLRHSQLNDVVDRIPIYSPSGAFDAPGNIGAGRKDEAIVSLNLPLGRFGIKGGLLKIQGTARDSQVTDPTTGVKRPISALRPLEGEIDFSQDLPKYHFTWGGSLYSGWRQEYYRLSEIESDTITPIGGLFAEYWLRKDCSIRGEIHNIGEHFNRNLVDWYGPRNAFPLATDDVRHLSFGPTYYLRVRKTF